MSQIHKVIDLKQPLKIFDFTPFQIIVMAFGLIGGLIAGTQNYGNAKVNGLPVGFLIGLLIFCVSMVISHMAQIKPFVWWKSMVIYKLKLAPTIYMPHPEEPIEYLDASMGDSKYRKDDGFLIREDRIEDEDDF
jgi:uncharacterized membrane protein required for colicin V production